MSEKKNDFSKRARPQENVSQKPDPFAGTLLDRNRLSGSPEVEVPAHLAGTLLGKSLHNSSSAPGKAGYDFWRLRRYLNLQKDSSRNSDPFAGTLLDRRRLNNNSDEESLAPHAETLSGKSSHNDNPDDGLPPYCAGTLLDKSIFKSPRPTFNIGYFLWLFNTYIFPKKASPQNSDPFAGTLLDRRRLNNNSEDESPAPPAETLSGQSGANDNPDNGLPVNTEGILPDKQLLESPITPHNPNDYHWKPEKNVFDYKQKAEDRPVMGSHDWKQASSMNGDRPSLAQRNFYEKLKPLWENNPDVDQYLIRLPELALESAERYRDKTDWSMAYKIFAEQLSLWFTEASTDNSYSDKAYFVPWGWATNFDLAQNALKDIKNNLTNAAAIANLESKLKDLVKNNKDVTPFDFTRLPPTQWNAASFQSRPVLTPEYAVFLEKYPQGISLGKFTINALPKGHVRRLKDGSHEICLDDVFLFVNDSFDFENDQLLGAWDFKHMQFVGKNQIYDIFEDGTKDHKVFWNSSFRKFKSKTGYGKDFRVVSPLQRVEDFAGKCWRIQ